MVGDVNIFLHGSLASRRTGDPTEKSEGNGIEDDDFEAEVEIMIAGEGAYSMFRSDFGLLLGRTRLPQTWPCSGSIAAHAKLRNRNAAPFWRRHGLPENSFTITYPGSVSGNENHRIE